VKAARHPHRPDAVTEVSLQFAEDGGGGEGGEGRAAGGVEAAGKTLESIAQPLSAAKRRLGGAEVESGQEPPAAMV
jgi:hypothetical protein